MLADHPCCQQNQPNVLISHLNVKEICDQVHFHLPCSKQAPKRKMEEVTDVRYLSSQSLNKGEA